MRRGGRVKFCGENLDGLATANGNNLNIGGVRTNPNGEVVKPSTFGAVSDGIPNKSQKHK
jgi:hypothetical protein